MRLVFLVAACVAILVGRAASLSITQSNPLWMFSDQLTESDNGISSINFNAPYHSVRHTLAQAVPTARITFSLTPYLPVSATRTSFQWSLETPVTQFPSWLTYVAGAPASNEFTLLYNATAHLAASPPADPEPFIVEFAGTVEYTHGPTGYIEHESRSLDLIVYMHLLQTPAQRSSMLAPFSTAAQSGQYTPFTTTQPNAAITSLTAEAFELFRFQCGGSAQSATGGCTLGGAANAPVWFGMNSVLNVTAGVLNVTGPLAMWGQVVVGPGATLILRGPTPTTAMAVMSDNLLPAILNNGRIVVEKG